MEDVVQTIKLGGRNQDWNSSPLGVQCGRECANPCSGGGILDRAVDLGRGHSGERVGSLLVLGSSFLVISSVGTP